MGAASMSFTDNNDADPSAYQHSLIRCVDVTSKIVLKYISTA